MGWDDSPEVPVAGNVLNPSQSLQQPHFSAIIFTIISSSFMSLIGKLMTQQNSIFKSEQSAPS